MNKLPPFNAATHFTVEDGRTEALLVRRSDGVAEFIQHGDAWLPCRSTPVDATPGPVQAEAEPVKVRLEIQVENPSF